MVGAGHRDVARERGAPALAEQRVLAVKLARLVAADAGHHRGAGGRRQEGGREPERGRLVEPQVRLEEIDVRDRKSTRLNSSHLVISYAVFCLKKKNNSPVDGLAPQTIASR